MNTRLDNSANTRLDQSRADGQTRLDQASIAIQQSGMRSIPSTLEANYRIIEPIPTQGAEADLFIIEDLIGGGNFVLKLYRLSLKPKSDVIKTIQACAREHVVQILEWGESDGLWYEVMEYGAHGTLRDMLLKGPLQEQQALEIFRELFTAIEHIHTHKIIHRDLKPENILIRSMKPLDLMLADFGIASISDATQHFTTKSRTIKYGAPEAAAGAIGYPSDYWSLGLIILEGLTGKHPFDGLSDTSIVLQLTTKAIDVTSVMNTRWRGLCQGLLTRDPKKRWSSEQINEWLTGGMPEIALENLERPLRSPYKFSKQECWTAVELAIEFGRNWEEGEKHLARKLLLPWIRDELRDQDAANLIIDLDENRTLSNEDRLVRLIANLGKGLPPVWQGLSLDQSTLISLCNAALQGDAVKATQIETIFEKQVLDVWGQSGNEECAEWNQLWKNSADAFSLLFNQIIVQSSLSKTLPDKKAYLPVLLLLILSQEFRESIRSEILDFLGYARRCFWLVPLLKDETYSALLVIHSFKDEAVSHGGEEIEAAKKLEEEIKKIEREYSEVLTVNSPFLEDIDGLRVAIQENHAGESLKHVYPWLSSRIFDASGSLKVGRSFSSMNKRLWFELLADGLFVSCIIVGVRMWMGNSLADDSFGILGARVSVVMENLGQAKVYLFAGLGVLALVWVGLGASTRRLAKRFFGNE